MTGEETGSGVDVVVTGGVSTRQSESTNSWNGSTSV